jgi:hypothetical protein
MPGVSRALQEEQRINLILTRSIGKLHTQLHAKDEEIAAMRRILFSTPEPAETHTKHYPAHGRMPTSRLERA